MEIVLKCTHSFMVMWHYKKTFFFKKGSDRISPVYEVIVVNKQDTFTVNMTKKSSQQRGSLLKSARVASFSSPQDTHDAGTEVYGPQRPFCTVPVQNMAAECRLSQLRGVYFIECLFLPVKHATQGPCGAKHSNPFLLALPV